MYTYKANVIKVVDGDTLDLDIDLGFDLTLRVRVRLLGIDAPETRTTDLVEKERGLLAKYRLIELLDSVSNQCIVQTFSDKGKFGRWLATIIIKDEGDKEVNLNNLLIDEGLAEKWI